MKKIKNLTQYLVSFPLISLSMMGLNLATAAAAIPEIPNANTTKTTLIAQRLTCNVVNIQRGQLALRSSPNGKSRAGLNNGNTVALLREGTAPWVFVRVINGPNSRVNGLEGWVNSDYLSCGEMSETQQISCEVVNIQTGQLALRFTPNGKSKAGLNNGNIVRWLKNGDAPWVYVRVLEGPNSRVNGLEGWVNSDYLSCYD